VRILDGRDDSIPRFMPLEVSPDAVAVVAGRALVLDSRGTTHDPDRWAWLPSN